MLEKQKKKEKNRLERWKRGRIEGEEWEEEGERERRGLGGVVEGLEAVNLFVREGELEGNRAEALSSIREAELELKVLYFSSILFRFFLLSFV